MGPPHEGSGRYVDRESIIYVCMNWDKTLVVSVVILQRKFISVI